MELREIRRERRLQDESGESLLAQGSAVHEVDDIDDDPNAIGERHSGTASAWSTGANLLKSYVGSGILGLPFAFRESGLIGGIVMMCLIALISTHCMLILVQVKEELVKRTPLVVSFSDIAQHLYGTGASRAVDAVLIFTQLGFCTVYLVFVAESLQEFFILPSGYAHFAIIAALIPTLTALSFIRTLRFLGLPSAIAMVALSLGIVIVLAVSVAQLQLNKKDNLPSPITVGVAWQSLPVAFGMGVYAFEGIGTVVPCQTAMKHPKSFPLVLIICMLIATSFYLCFGSVAYSAFGSVATDEQIMKNVHWFAETVPLTPAWSSLELIARISLTLGVFLTFPVQLFVVSDILDGALFTSGRCSPYGETAKKNLIRFGLVCFCSLIASTVPHFGLLTGFVGAIGGTSLQFLLPPLFYVKLFPDASFFKRLLMTVYVGFGVIGGTSAAGVTLHELYRVLKGD